MRLFLTEHCSRTRLTNSNDRLVIKPFDFSYYNLNIKDTKYSIGDSINKILFHDEIVPNLCFFDRTLSANTFNEHKISLLFLVQLCWNVQIVNIMTAPSQYLRFSTMRLCYSLKVVKIVTASSQCSRFSTIIHNKFEIICIR